MPAWQGWSPDRGRPRVPRRSEDPAPRIPFPAKQRFARRVSDRGRFAGARGVAGCKDRAPWEHRLNRGLLVRRLLIRGGVSGVRLRLRQGKWFDREVQ